MTVCACDECDCIITLDPTLPAGAICDWCESDRHGKPRSHTVESERAGVTIHAYPRNGLVVVETRRDAASVVNRVFLNRDAARKLADQLYLAIIGGSK